MYLDYFMQTSIKWLPLYKTVKLAHFPAFFITFSSFSEDFAIISARLRAFNSSMVLEFIHTLCFWKSSKKLSQGESNQDLQTQIKCPSFSHQTSRKLFLLKLNGLIRSETRSVVFLKLYGHGMTYHKSRIGFFVLEVFQPFVTDLWHGTFK